MSEPFTKGARRIWILNIVLLVAIVAVIDWAWRTISEGGS